MTSPPPHRLKDKEGRGQEDGAVAREAEELQVRMQH